ncbi:MAG: hypothetical protein M0Q51_03440 [Bacteroidales bacterium]|nr:hypothetical protein [Bacteroidales bacterium]
MNATQTNLFCLLFSLQIIIFGWPAFSQPKDNQTLIDSLESALQQTTRQDTARVLLLAKLGKLYIYKDARQAISYAQEAVDLSEKLKIQPDAMTYLYMARAYGRIPDNENAFAQ